MQGLLIRSYQELLESDGDFNGNCYFKTLRTLLRFCYKSGQF